MDSLIGQLEGKKRGERENSRWRRTIDQIIHSLHQAHCSEKIARELRRHNVLTWAFVFTSDQGSYFLK